MTKGFLFTAIRSSFVEKRISAQSYAKLVKMAMHGVDLEVTYDTLLKEIDRKRNHGDI